MAQTPDEPTAEFWDHVRDALHAYLKGCRSGEQSGTGISTQAQLATALGLKPQTLSNFLSAKKTNKSIGGWGDREGLCFGN